jgi:hypothetical protein
LTHRYKLGKQPARAGAVKLRFADYADTATLPTPPASFGHDRLVGSWGMLLNDRIGDCAIAGALHETMLWNLEAGVALPITNKSALTNYENVTGYKPGPELENPDAPPNPTDQGTDIPTLIKYRYTTGVSDDAGRPHKIGGAVALEPGNWEQLIYATYYFDGVGVGLQLPEQWQDAFADGKPWDKLRRPNIEGGHYVTAVAARDNNVVLVSWGGEVEITKAGYEQFSDESFAYLSVEKLKNGVDLDGLNLSALSADLPELLDVGAGEPESA